MRCFCLFFLCFAAVALIGGCNGDDDGTAAGIILAQGTKTIGASTDEMLAQVNVSEPGTLQGTITWSGPPTELAAVFVHIAPSDMLGFTLSPSPTVAGVAVTSARVAAGHEWGFAGVNSSSTAVSVSYTVTFTPE